MPAWKIASGEVNNRPMLAKIVETGKPVLLSTGMSPLSEIQETISFLQEQQVPVLVFQTTTAYPCPPEHIGLNNIPIYREFFDIPVGLSDHSGTIYSSLAAAALNIDMLEIHVTFSKQMFGPDVSASITLEELSQVVQGIRYIEKITNNPVDKDKMASELKPLRDLFSKSIVCTRKLAKGHIIQRDDITFKKPGTGLPPDAMNLIIGRRLAQQIEIDHKIVLTDVE